MRLTFTIAKCILLISVSLTLLFASSGEKNTKDYFVTDSLSMSNINQWMVNVLSINPKLVLEKTNSTLQNNPQYLKAHLLKGLLYLYRFGDITKAINEFEYINNINEDLVTNRNLSGDEMSELRSLENQTKRQINLINREFGNLKLSIKNVDIDRYCYIKNMDIAITFSEEVLSKSSDLQKLRFTELQNNLKTGGIKLKFNTFDSTDNKYYFEIPYFPLVSISSNALPYSLIINNTKRYHFILDRQYNQKLNIDWNNKWKLVEAVPDNSIKLEFPSNIDVRIAQHPATELLKTYSIPEQKEDTDNLYIKTNDAKNLELVIKSSGNRNKIEKYLYYTNRVMIGLGLLVIVLFIR